MNTSIIRLLSCWTLTTGFLLSTPGYCDDYYRWVDAEGVVHYGSRPPDGVNAVKINTYGKSQGAPAAAARDNDTGPETKPNAAQSETLALRQAQCEEEKERLRVLQTPGSRIRMEQDDGSIRYLTPVEIAKEVNSSEKFISEACK